MSYFQAQPQIGGLLGNFGLPDYASGVQSALAENAAKPKPKKDMWWLGAIGDAMQAFNGQEGTYAAAMAEKQKAEMAEHQRQLQRSEGREDKIWEAEHMPQKPSVFEMGSSLVSYDPKSAPSVVYQGESPAEQYAKALGAEPGTPAYVNAIKDFVLKVMARPGP
ncbi:MAG: hypothetical protein JWN69_2529 [Alphaproteobacteria bacterium]|nr:hypothetical protein [Alphaproteobacteria bacterium]